MARPLVPLARLRIAVAGLIALALAGGYKFWLRDSSLVAVEKVEVIGATAKRGAITRALTEAAVGMTTLNVDEKRLAAALRRFRTVESIRTNATIPHSLEIEVIERLPVALALRGGVRVPVSADGFWLEGLEADRESRPRVNAQVGLDGRVDRGGLAQLTVLGGAPRKIAARIHAAASDGPGGVVIRLGGGLELRFGNPDRLEAKWRAAELVLGDPEVGMPSYVDISVPERPVSG